MSHNPAILCRGLHKRYPSRNGFVDAVNGLDLEVWPGECVGLLGPNGAGKTTTIEILEGLLAPTSGEVVILGRKWGRDDAALRARLGISLQETRLAEKLTARETLALFRSFYDRGLTPGEALDRVGLVGKADSYVGQLSGGQRQRLAVACSLIGDPELLFLDEPSTGLDPQSRRQLWEVLRAFRGGGRSILLTTHAMDEAERLCDRVAIVDRGKVIAAGAPAELIARAGGPHLLEFASAGNGDLEESALSSLPGVLSVGRQPSGYRLGVSAPHLTLPALLALLQRRGRELTRLATRQASLEDVYLTLTGRSWSEDESDSGDGRSG